MRHQVAVVQRIACLGFDSATVREEIRPVRFHDEPVQDIRFITHVFCKIHINAVDPQKDERAADLCMKMPAVFPLRGSEVIYEKY